MGDKRKQKGKQKKKHLASTYSEIKTLEQYKAKGKEINKKYCVFEDNSPIMLPPAPKQHYVDLHNDDEDYNRRQANYEAEVTVYRALESLNEDILVLHEFEYTHHQYRLCDQSHDRRNCPKCKRVPLSSYELECDFLVIGRNYCVIIEVKNIPLDGDDEFIESRTPKLKGAFDKSLKQRERTNSLIEGLVDQVREVVYAQHCPIVHYSAFPNTPRIQLQNMDEEHKSQIMCKEVFSDFSSWWQKNVTDLVPDSATVPETFLTKHEEVKEVLIAIWCTDGNQCDELKCSLGKCILDIDEELRKRPISFLSKNRPSNPNVKKLKPSGIEAASNNSKTGILTDDAWPATRETCDFTPQAYCREVFSKRETDRINIFRDIGVDNLTAEQFDAFNRDQNLLLINGPAGSGKTIILLAKIVQVIRANEQNRVVLITFCGLKFTITALQKARISYAVLNCDALIQEISDSISNTNSMQNNQVVVVGVAGTKSELVSDILGSLTGSTTHVFIDDFQEVYRNMTSVDEILRRCKELSVTNRVLIACDLTQTLFYSSRELRDEKVRSCHISCVPHRDREETRDTWQARSPLQDIHPVNPVTLSGNLRNTCDLSSILSTIRQQLVQYYVFGAETADIDIVLPVPQPRHFIHGPRVVVHVIDKVYKRDSSLIADILNKELDKLCNTGVSRGLNVGILHSGTDLSSEIRKIKEERSRVSDNEIAVLLSGECYSAEHPAVIVVHNFACYRFNDISPLYLEMSRARVYCAVILFSTDEDVDVLSEEEEVSGLLHKLEDSVKIIRYD